MVTRKLLIALRGDRHLLHDPEGLFTLRGHDVHAEREALYRQGFSVGRLIEVVESQAVWQGILVFWLLGCLKLAM